jgi:hypothetical protein
MGLGALNQAVLAAMVKTFFLNLILGYPLLQKQNNYADIKSISKSLYQWFKLCDCVIHTLLSFCTLSEGLFKTIKVKEYAHNINPRFLSKFF